MENYKFEERRRERREARREARKKVEREKGGEVGKGKGKGKERDEGVRKEESRGDRKGKMPVGHAESYRGSGREGTNDGHGSGRGRGRQVDPRPDTAPHLYPQSMHHGSSGMSSRHSGNPATYRGPNIRGGKSRTGSTSTRAASRETVHAGAGASERFQVYEATSHSRGVEARERVEEQSRGK